MDGVRHLSIRQGKAAGALVCTSDWTTTKIIFELATCLVAWLSLL